MLSKKQPKRGNSMQKAIGTGYEICQGLRLLDIREVALIFGISPASIYRRLCQGTFDIPPVRVGRLLRWTQESVRDYIDSASEARKDCV